MSESNVEAARAAYDAFRAGDMQRLGEGFAADAEWMSSDELPQGGEIHGREEILASFAQLPDYWSEFDVEPDRFLDCGETVVVTGKQSAKGEGGSFESRFVHLLEFRDGKVARGEFWSDSAKALKSLGSLTTH